ncbi:hypothetical protein GCM10027294_21370 [Marinactinospora endophytica]
MEIVQSLVNTAGIAPFLVSFSIVAVKAFSLSVAGVMKIVTSGYRRRIAEIERRAGQALREAESVELKNVGPETALEKLREENNLKSSVLDNLGSNVDLIRDARERIGRILDGDLDPKNRREEGASLSPRGILEAISGVRKPSTRDGGQGQGRGKGIG